MLMRSVGRLRRWIDAHLVGLGVAMLTASATLAALLATYQEVWPRTSAPSSTFIVSFVLATQLSRVLIYLGGFLIGVGILLRNWQVVIVGFENSDLKELIVDGPDDNNIVWLGKRYSNAFEAEAAFGALEKRATAEQAKSRET
jgi:hypothetical protein